MSELLKDCAKNVLEKMNLFVILQIMWIIEFYILAIFSAEELLSCMIREKIEKPLIILEYSQKIVNWLDTYSSFIFVIGIILIFAGISGSFLKNMPVLKKYKTIYMYMDFGLYAGVWLLLIFYTYNIYMWMRKAFLMAPIIAYILYELVKKVNEWLETKGITFSE